MSTSCKPALESGPGPEVRPFPYAELPAGNPRGGPALRGETGCGSCNTENSQQLMQLEKARQEGEARASAAFARQVEEMRARVCGALADFARERANYYHKVEAEVLQLALNIARKILRREAQIDRLLLAGMVRVALEKIESATKVVVRVHPDQLSEFRAYFAQHLEPQNVPEVVEDPRLALQQCVLETVLGTTELGPEVQLKEIEQGLFDLLGQRPGVGS